MRQRVKLSRPIVVAGEKVEIVRMVGDRIPAGSYYGWIDDSTATVGGANSFRVPLGINFRRPVACQVIVAPGVATVIPRPTLNEAFGLLCQSIDVRPLNGSGNWHCAVTVELDCGEAVKYCRTSASYNEAVYGATELARKNAVEWYDPDPLSPDPTDILEAPTPVLDVMPYPTIPDPTGPIQ